MNIDGRKRTSDAYLVHHGDGRKVPAITLSALIAAIDGSAGDKTLIANRLGVVVNTVNKGLAHWKRAQRAFDMEQRAAAGWAEAVVLRNIKLAWEAQETATAPVDCKDARWLLERLDRRGVDVNINVNRPWPQIIEVAIATEGTDEWQARNITEL